MEKVLLKISEKIKKEHTVQSFTDMFGMVREAAKTDLPLAMRYGRWLSEELERYIPVSGKDIKELYPEVNRYLTILIKIFYLFIEEKREPDCSDSLKCASENAHPYY